MSFVPDGMAHICENVKSQICVNLFNPGVRVTFGSYLESYWVVIEAWQKNMHPLICLPSHWPALCGKMGGIMTDMLKII